MYSIHKEKLEEFFGGEQHDNGDWSAVVAPTESIVLCFTNRCGSTYVASLLSQYGLCGKPNHHKNYEFFNYDAAIEVCEERSFKSLGRYAKYTSMAHRSSSGVFLTKASIDQIAWLESCGVIGRRFVSPLFIEVVRDSVEDQAISLEIAQQTSRW